jgi:tetratricopeptide (TPR) repeat protein
MWTPCWGLAQAYIVAATILSLGDPDELLRHAKDAVGRALTINPRNARALWVKSFVLAYSTELDYRGHIDGAIDAAEIAIALDRNLGATWLGRLYAKAGHPERTAAFIEQAMRLNPRGLDTAPALSTLGMSELQMGHYDVAVATFRKSVAENPNLAISWGNLTAAFLGAGREPEARIALGEVRKRDARLIPDQPDEQLKLMRLQLGLLRRGFWPYAVDGRDTRQLSEALSAFQRDESLPQNGILDEATAARLELEKGQTR